MARILIAVDLSDVSRTAMEAGAALARDLRATVVLVHAYEPLPRVPGYATSLGGSYDDLKAHEEDWRARQEQELEKLADALRESGLEVLTVLRKGEPDEVVLAAAQEHDVQILVLGSHGRRGVRRFVLGSVAQTVLHQAKRPVLVVPAS